jgi:uncharacterized phage-associated protein
MLVPFPNTSSSRIVSDVSTVSEELLKHAKVQLGIGLNPVQLNKLSYIAYGLHLANFNTKLFPEEIGIGSLGPIIWSLYDKYQYYEKEIIKLYLSADVSEIEFSINGESKTMLEALIRQWGKLTTAELCNFCHEPNSPYRRLRESDKNALIIPDYMIKTYFKKLMEESK